MSTYLYLVCKAHNPPLKADGESGQHLYDLPQIRKDIVARDLVVAAARADIWSDDSFRRNTARFLLQHPHCTIGIRDEYGQGHATTEDA